MITARASHHTNGQLNKKDNSRSRQGKRAEKAWKGHHKPFYLREVIDALKDGAGKKELIIIGQTTLNHIDKGQDRPGLRQTTILKRGSIY